MRNPRYPWRYRKGFSNLEESLSVPSCRFSEWTSKGVEVGVSTCSISDLLMCAIVIRLAVSKNSKFNVLESCEWNGFDYRRGQD